MICKSLEKKITLVPEMVEKDNFYPFELEYYLVESECEGLEDIAEDKVFGMEIVKKAHNLEAESKMVKNFTCCREKALKTLETLARNTVTPVELLYILDDMLAG